MYENGASCLLSHLLLVICSVYSASQLTPFFGHIMMLNLDLTHYSNPRSEQCPHRLVQKALGMQAALLHPLHSFYPDALITLE